MKKVINTKKENNIILDKRQARRNRYHIKRFFNLYLSQVFYIEKDFKKEVLYHLKRKLKKHCDLKDPHYKPFKKFGWGNKHNVFKNPYRKINKDTRATANINVHYRT